MRQEILRKFKNCASCQYWTGERDLHSSNFVYVETGTKGRCTNPTGKYKGFEKYAPNTCDAYKKL